MVHATQCPRCSWAIQADDEYCEQCGFQLTQEQSSATEQSRAYDLPAAIGSRKTLKSLAYIGAATILVLVLLSYSFMYLYPKSSDTTDAKSAVAPATPTPTPTLLLDTPIGVVLRPGQAWYRDGLTLKLESWDGDQIMAFVVYNQADKEINLAEIPLRVKGLAPDGKLAAGAITVHEVKLEGILAPGESRPFSVAITIDRERRSEWPRIIFVVEVFDRVRNAQWELEIINTPTATATATPTATATATPLPTDTPTPMPTTLPGTVLEPGTIWYEGGLALWLNLISVDHDKLRIDLILENQSARAITGSSSYLNYRLVTNLGQVVNPPHYSHYSTVENFRPEANFSLYGKFEIHPGERKVVARNGVFELDLTDPSITEVTIEVVELSRITIARWRIPIPH